MDWTEVLERPELRNLPFKIETNRYGQIVMSPATNRHNMFQGAIYAELLKMKLSGGPQFEPAIRTTDGVKVADVAWYSTSFLKIHREEVAFTAAPEICIEVLSPSNSQAEIDEKTRLYFQHGASEVWICDSGGKMTFKNSTQELLQSEIFPEFPLLIVID